jgi:anti-sigma regulatory factor (Ser/Thr protein kinase)
MEDLSLHILDIIENSIDAGARNIEIQIREDSKQDLLSIEIADDGKGMDEATLKKALDPFFTTKTVRKVGLGLSLFRESAREANGDLEIQSKVGQGTRLRATFQRSHIDRRPLGDMRKTVMTLIIGHPETRFKYVHEQDGRKFELDTKKLADKNDLSSMSAIELMNLIKRSMPEKP